MKTLHPTAAALLCTALLAACSNDISGESEVVRSDARANVAMTAQCAHFAADSFLERDELAPAALPAGAQMLTRFIHLTDTHITDDDGQITNGASLIDPAYPSAQRLHEEYSDELLNDFIKLMNACDASYPSEFMVITGDITDLTTIAETRRVIDNLDGTFDATGAFETTCTTALGADAPAEVQRELCLRHTGKGIADTESAMPDPDNGVYQFQVTRTLSQTISTEEAAATGRWSDGSTDPARQTVTQAPGLPQHLRCEAGSQACDNQHAQIPWMAAFGNHDGYIRGTVAGGTGFNEASQSTGRHFMIHQHEFIDEFFYTKPFPGPVGHGFNFADEARKNDDNDRNDGYYSFAAGDGRLRMIVLNTMYDGIDERLGTDQVRNPAAVASGWVDSAQFEWLKAELAAAYAQQQLVMVFSHHPDTSFAVSAALPSNVPAAMLDAELASWPHMVAWIAGHTHRHKIRPFIVSGETGSNGSIETTVECKVAGACRGFWQIETSSMLDHPQEQRMIEVYATDNGHGVIRAPVFGHTLEPIKRLAATDRGCTLFPTSVDDVTTAVSQVVAGSACLGGDVPQGDARDRNVLLGFTLPQFR